MIPTPEREAGLWSDAWRQLRRNPLFVLPAAVIVLFTVMAVAQGGGGSNDAAAKKILEDVCTACHDLDLVSDQHLSKEDWTSVVSSMQAKGASLDDKDKPMLVEYLAKTYPPKK